MHTHSNSFHGLGIAPGLLQILSHLRYITPTPIQQQCIPLAIEGKDIVGIAQTGTGKTLAFGIPMMQSLAREEGEGLVVVPTRELALQVNEALTKIGHPLGIGTAVLIGGETMDSQHKQLRLRPQVIVATPGRLIDHLQQRTVFLSSTRILVLDEADRMLDMGFYPQIKIILRHLPGDRQTMLFSATMPAEIVNVAAHSMRLPVRVEVAPTGTTPEDVSQEVFFVDQHEKIRLLENLLVEYHGSVLVFTRTKFGARKLARQLRSGGHNTVELHSDRSLAQRRDAMDGFRVGKYRILVATDIAARGIDVSGIELVVNYDLPATGEDYVHRIGRTARAGAAGHAVSFAMPHQRSDLKSIEQVIRTAVRVSPLPELRSRPHRGKESAQPSPNPPRRRSKFHRTRKNARAKRARV